MRLSVAVPRQPNHCVHNFSSNILRDLSIVTDVDGQWHVKVKFTRLQRQLRMLINNNEEWHFTKDKFEVNLSTLRNGSITYHCSLPAAPLFTHTWVQTGNTLTICQELEKAIPARCVVERYLFKHVPDPTDYCIVVFDFNSQNAIEGHPPFLTHDVRSVEETENAVLTDNSEDATAWLKLLEGT